MTSGDGFRLFLDFAEGCRSYLMDKGAISESDNAVIRNFIQGSGPAPETEVLERVYPAAMAGIREVSRRFSLPMFDSGAVREFYLFDHNARKFLQGNLSCLAFPAMVLDIDSVKREALVQPEPISGPLRLPAPEWASAGSWVTLHRMRAVEPIDDKLAERASSYLRGLGLDKSMSFPRQARKYMLGLASRW